MHRINRINSLGINPTNELEWSIATCSCVQTDLASMLHLTALQYKNPTGTQLFVVSSLQSGGNGQILYQGHKLHKQMQIQQM